MSLLNNTLVKEIVRFSDVISKVLRDNFTNIKNAHNNLENTVDNLVIDSGTSDAETIAARDNAIDLKTNIHLRSIFGDVVTADGLIVTQQTVADDTVKVSTGSGIVEGIGVVVTSPLSSPSISSSSAGNHRIVVIVIETDNTVDVVESAEVLTSLVATYPTIAATQKALAYVLIDDTAVVINDADITDLRFKGATVNGKQFFNPQDAIDTLDTVVGGDIVLGSGDYLGENMDLTGFSNVRIEMNTGAKSFRALVTDTLFKCVNTVSNEASNITLIGGEFFGNGVAGSVPLFEIAFTDNFRWLNTTMDGNDSSTATHQNFTIDNCDGFMLQGLVGLDGSGIQTSKRELVSNSRNWTSMNNGVFVNNNFSLFDYTMIFNKRGGF